MRRGRVASVMAAYNRVNGQPCAASPWLLGDVLRRSWGFDGYVVGDCGAVGDVFAGHHAAPTREAAAAAALRAGTDLDCGSDFGALRGAAAQGLVTDADLDRALVRLLTARVRLGHVRSAGRGPLVGAGPRDRRFARAPPAGARGRA